jgi:hypothetical protein
VLPVEPAVTYPATELALAIMTAGLLVGGGVEVP